MGLYWSFLAGFERETCLLPVSPPTRPRPFHPPLSPIRSHSLSLSATIPWHRTHSFVPYVRIVKSLDSAVFPSLAIRGNKMPLPRVRCVQPEEVDVPAGEPPRSPITRGALNTSPERLKESSLVSVPQSLSPHSSYRFTHTAGTAESCTTFVSMVSTPAVRRWIRLGSGRSDTRVYLMVRPSTSIKIPAG